MARRGHQGDGSTPEREKAQGSNRRLQLLNAIAAARDLPGEGPGSRIVTRRMVIQLSYHAAADDHGKRGAGGCKAVQTPDKEKASKGKLRGAAELKQVRPGLEGVNRREGGQTLRTEGDG